MIEWLVKPEFRDLTPDRYHAGYKPEKVRPVEALVYHYTASRSPTGTRSWLTTADEHYVSAHFIVERDGDVWQLAPLTDRTFHAGGATSKLFGAGGVNERTISIEVMNVGPLVERDGEWFDLNGKRFRGAMVCAGGPPRYRFTVWEAYAAPQIAALCNLTNALARVFPILTSDPGRLVGHEDVDPTRKTDPGPAFPWAIVRASACSEV